MTYNWWVLFAAVKSIQILMRILKIDDGSKVGGKWQAGEIIIRCSFFYDAMNQFFLFMISHSYSLNWQFALVVNDFLWEFLVCSLLILSQHFGNGILLTFSVMVAGKQPHTHKIKLKFPFSFTVLGFCVLVVLTEQTAAVLTRLGTNSAQNSASLTSVCSFHRREQLRI